MECIICLAKVKKQERYENPITCNHTQFHSSCLREWYAVTPSCPVCKCTNEWYIQAQQAAASRQRRRRHMAAGLGAWGQEEEDVSLAVALSMFCESDNK